MHSPEQYRAHVALAVKRAYTPGTRGARTRMRRQLVGRSFPAPVSACKLTRVVQENPDSLAVFLAHMTLKPIDPRERRYNAAAHEAMRARDGVLTIPVPPIALP